MCVEDTFHPEDLLAMGFALAAIAFALRNKWGLVGIVIALAFLSQQFAILVAAPLLVVAPATKRLVYASSAVGTVALVALPLLWLSSGRAGHTIFFGTGDTGGIGGTVLWELGFHGGPLFTISRLAPIIFAVLIARWTVRRLGTSSLEPVPLLSIIAIALGLRLVFEQNIFGYYFMALAVSLVVLEVARGHIRRTLVAWLITVSAVYLSGATSLDVVGKTWATALNALIPIIVTGFAVTLIISQILRHNLDWRIGLWLGMIAAVLFAWDRTETLGSPPPWLWQVLFVPLGLGLAFTPLWAELERRARSESSGLGHSPSTA
jgi:hypothetical protein